jgi:DNA-binding CsgD family transcriptional regulator
MRETLVRLGAAADTDAAGKVLAEAAARLVGFGSFAFVPLDPRPQLIDSLVIESNEFPVATMRKAMLGVAQAFQRELGGIVTSFAEGSPTFELGERFPLARVERLSVYQDYWRPLKLDRQLIALMGGASEPLGFMCLARSRRERPFDDADRRAVEELRVHTERWLSSSRALGAGDLFQALDALAGAFPSAAFLFDGGGRLQWMSEEGSVRLALESARIGAMRLLKGNGALEALSRAAAALARDSAADVQHLLRSAGVPASGERLGIRRFQSGGRPLVLIALKPIGQGIAPAPVGAPRVATLGRVERRVAAHAAQGYSVLNISARLGISEATVRTHLRRVYVKLGVHSRVELARSLWSEPG